MNDFDSNSAVRMVKIQYTPTDYNSLSRIVARSYKMSWLIKASILVIIAVCFAASTSLVIFVLKIFDVFHVVALVAFSFPLGILLSVIASKPLDALYYKDRFNKKGAFLSPQKFTIDNVGFHAGSDVVQSFFRWSGILQIENTKEALLYYVDNMQAIYIPKRCFASLDEAEAFHRQAEQYWQAARAQPATGTPT